MEKTVTLKPFDYDVADDVYSCLFQHIPGETETGLMPTPAASYQLVVSALELVLWDVHGEQRDIIRKAIGITEYLRDVQKQRERTARMAARNKEE